MKRSLRIGTLLAALTLLGGALIVPARAQDPKFDATFAAAKKMEAEQPSQAIDAYAKIKKDAKDPALGADALLRAALVGYNAVTQNQADLAKLPAEARSQREQANLDVAHKGYDSLKQLL